MPPARSPAGTLYFNRRVQRPARNDQSIRRTPDRSVPQPAFAAARVGQAVPAARAAVTPLTMRHPRMVRSRTSRHARSLATPARVVLLVVTCTFHTPGTKNLVRSPF